MPTRGALAALAVVCGLVINCGTGPDSSNFHATGGTSTDLAQQVGQAGERWGGFIFQDSASPIPYPATPAPSGPVANEEAIPDAFPGTRTFSSLTDIAASKLLAPALMLAPPTAPAGYELIGAYVIISESGAPIDFCVSYRRSGRKYAGELPEVFSPQLSIGWTARAPQPLPAETTPTDGGLGRKALPRTKVTVRGYHGVFMDWINPANTPDEFLTASNLNWFDEAGRLWFVQGVEPFASLLQIAESLTAPG